MATLHKFVLMGNSDDLNQWRMICYYKSAVSFTPTGGGLTTWATAVMNTILAVMCNRWHLYAVGYSPYLGAAPETDPKGWGATVVYNCALTGGDAGENLPSQCAPVVLGRTETKHVFGRKFLPGVTETNSQFGLPSAALKTAMSNFGGIVFASTYTMDGTPLTPGCWGKNHGFTETVSTSNSLYFGSQRRRKPGLGI